MRLTDTAGTFLAQAQLQINDDDASISIGDKIMAEGDVGLTTFTFGVTTNRAKNVPVSANWTIVQASGASATAGVDFVVESGTVTIDPDDNQQGTIDVHIIGDTLREGTEQFNVLLSDPINCSLGDASGLGQILNDDAGISALPAVVDEGDSGTTDLVFTIELDLLENSDVEVAYTVPGSPPGNATPGVDYEPVSGTALIPEGQLSTDVTVLVYGDIDVETNESVRLQLSNPVGASILSGTGFGTINDDDPDPTVSVGDVSVVEGDGGLTAVTITFTRTALNVFGGALNFRTMDGTATAPEDYVATANGSVSFQSDALTATATVQVKGDIVPEGDEQFTVEVFSAVNLDIDPEPGTVTIVEDDNQTPVVTITSPADGSTLVGTTVSFNGTAVDAEDGDISGTLSWRSDLDDDLGTGAAISASLSPGTHVVTAEAVDAFGATGSATITVTVVLNEPPVLSIVAPADGATFPEGAGVTLTATANDPEDGDLGADVVWTSDIDGDLGTGASIAVQLSPDTHVISADVVDSLGASATAAVEVTVSAASVELQAFINQLDDDAPPGQTYAVGVPLAFSYEVSNPGPHPLDSVFVDDDNGTPTDPTDDFVPDYVSGDDGNGILDVGETWLYTADREAIEGAVAHLGAVQANAVGSAVPVIDTDPAYYTGVADEPTVPPPANETMVCASDPAPLGFGAALAVYDGAAVVGAPGAAAAYVFELVGDDWVETAVITDRSGYGGSIALHSSTIAGGGVEHVVVSDAGGSLIDTLVPSGPGTGFGAAVALHWDILLVGAPDADGTGAVYVFRDTPGGWVSEDMLVAPDGDPGDAFGAAVALVDDMIVVGAPGDDAAGADAGALYAYAWIGGAWTFTDKLADGQPGDEVGTSVAIGDLVVVTGAPGLDGAGGAYSYLRDGPDLAPLYTLTADDGAPGDAPPPAMASATRSGRPTRAPAAPTSTSRARARSRTRSARPRAKPCSAHPTTTSSPVWAGPTSCWATAATTRCAAATAATGCSVTAGRTPWRAAPVPTCSTAEPATTCSSVAQQPTSCSVAPATTSARVKAAPTSSTVATATTSSKGATATTRCSANTVATSLAEATATTCSGPETATTCATAGPATTTSGAWPATTSSWAPTATTPWWAGPAPTC